MLMIILFFWLDLLSRVILDERLIDQQEYSWENKRLIIESIPMKRRSSQGVDRQKKRESKTKVHTVHFAHVTWSVYEEDEQDK